MRRGQAAVPVGDSARSASAAAARGTERRRPLTSLAVVTASRHTGTGPSRRTPGNTSHANPLSRTKSRHTRPHGRLAITTPSAAGLAGRGRWLRRPGKPAAGGAGASEGRTRPFGGVTDACRPGGRGDSRHTRSCPNSSSRTPRTLVSHTFPEAEAAAAGPSGPAMAECKATATARDRWPAQAASSRRGAQPRPGANAPHPALQLPVTRSFWMDRMRLRAASQLARLPVMTMVSELLFSAGRSILVLLSSRIYDRGERAGGVSAGRPGWGGAPRAAGGGSRLQTPPRAVGGRHLLDVRASFPDDVLVELLEDRNRDRVAVLHLRNRSDGSHQSRHRAGDPAVPKGSIERQDSAPEQAPSASPSRLGGLPRTGTTTTQPGPPEPTRHSPVSSHRACHPRCRVHDPEAVRSGLVPLTSAPG